MSDESVGLTQFGRALKELGIEPIFANSPQAKGRVERANETLQDRLVKELRLRQISTIAAANNYLPEFTCFPRGSAARHPEGRCGNPRFLRQLRDESC